MMPSDLFTFIKKILNGNFIFCVVKSMENPSKKLYLDCSFFNHYI